MKSILLSLVLTLPAGGDPFLDGLKHYAAGEYSQAVSAFRAALKDAPDDPRLNYNLALACWRVGEMDAAETAAEKAAALSKGRLDVRRDGILGNIRYDQARAIADAKPAPPSQPVPGAKAPAPSAGPDLQKALDLLGQAKNHYLRAASASQPADKILLRNFERAIRFEEELKKRKEKQDQEDQQKDDQKKNDKQDQKDDKDKQPDDKKNDKKNDDEKKDEQKKDEKKQPDDQKDEQKDKEQPEPEPEPKKDEKKAPKPEADQDEEKPHKPQKPQQAPGEHDPNKQLTPEQRRQLLKRLEEFEKKLLELKAARRASRPKVKKDW